EDDTRGLLRRRTRQLLVEVLRELFLIEPIDGGGVPGDRGLDAAGMHARHIHRVAGDEHLLTEGFGEPAHRELSRVVWALPGHRKQPEDARDVDDVSVAG